MKTVIATLAALPVLASIAGQVSAFEPRTLFEQQERWSGGGTQ